AGQKPTDDSCVVTREEDLTKLSSVVDRAESDYIKNVYLRLKRNKTETAKVLGISLRSLYYKMQKYSIS
ncbi:MAG TPA: hypothetical protein DCM73_13495, partial [Clostridiales bacterium]|nr:hypothetical protein [Clostridiales bacterium]